MADSAEEQRGHDTALLGAVDNREWVGDGGGFNNLPYRADVKRTYEVNDLGGTIGPGKKLPKTLSSDRIKDPRQVNKHMNKFWFCSLHFSQTYLAANIQCPPLLSGMILSMLLRVRQLTIRAFQNSCGTDSCSQIVTKS